MCPQYGTHQPAMINSASCATRPTHVASPLTCRASFLFPASPAGAIPSRWVGGLDILHLFASHSDMNNTKLPPDECVSVARSSFQHNCARRRRGYVPEASSSAPGPRLDAVRRAQPHQTWSTRSMIGEGSVRKVPPHTRRGKKKKTHQKRPLTALLDMIRSLGSCAVGTHLAAVTAGRRSRASSFFCSTHIIMAPAWSHSSAPSSDPTTCLSASAPCPQRSPWAQDGMGIWPQNGAPLLHPGHTDRQQFQAPPHVACL